MTASADNTGRTPNASGRRVTPTDYQALDAFQLALRRFLALSESGAMELGLTSQQHQALLAVRAHRGPGEITIGELANTLMIKNHSAIGLVDRLVERDLLERRDIGGIGELGAAIHDRLAARTRQLVEGLCAEAKQANIPFAADSVGGMFGVFFAEHAPGNFAEVMQCDKDRFNRFFHAMLGRGVYLAPALYEAGFVSAAHTEDDVAATVAAAEQVFQTLTK